MSVFLDTNYYRLLELLCSIVGLWPYQTEMKKRSIQFFNMFLMLSFLPPQLRRLYQVWGKDIDAICMCLPPLFSLVICIFKIVTIYRFEPKIKMLLQQIKIHWETTSKKKEYEILVNYTLKGKKLCFIYTILMNIGLFSYIGMPIISPILDIILHPNQTCERKIGFEVDYGVDPQIYWFWLWLHCSTAGTAVIFNLIAADILYITLVIHGCYLFRIAEYKVKYMTASVTEHGIESFGNSNYNIECNSYQYENQRRKLKEQAAIMRKCVINHREAIECAQLLNCIYTWNLLGTIVGNVIIISTSAVQLASNLFKWTEMFMSIIFTMSDLIHSFFLILPAQYILDQSLQFRESAYSCSWYNMPAKFQKDFILILIRSRSPCKLMVGKLFVLSMESFCAILQYAVSYIMLLASIR